MLSSLSKLALLHRRPGFMRSALGGGQSSPCSVRNLFLGVKGGGVPCQQCTRGKRSHDLIVSLWMGEESHGKIHSVQDRALASGKPVRSGQTSSCARLLACEHAPCQSRTHPGSAPLPSVAGLPRLSLSDGNHLPWLCSPSFVPTGQTSSFRSCMLWNVDACSMPYCSYVVFHRGCSFRQGNS